MGKQEHGHPRSLLGIVATVLLLGAVLLFVLALAGIVDVS